MAQGPGTGGSPRHTYRWLLAVPFVWQAGLAPVVNGVMWAPFGLPFPMLCGNWRESC